MKKPDSSSITIGIDLGDRQHAVCVLDAEGEVLKQESITSTRPSLQQPSPMKRYRTDSGTITMVASATGPFPSAGTRK